MIPRKLCQESQGETLDLFPSLGEVYSDVKSRFQNPAFKNHQKTVELWFSKDHDYLSSDSVLKMLAVSTCLVTNIKLKDMYSSYFDEHFHKLKNLFDSMSQVVWEIWPLFTVPEKRFEQHTTNLKHLLLLTSSVVQINEPLLSNFKLLMEDPLKLQEKFWPAMPESFYFSIPEELRLENGKDAVYKCPKGHYYTIGDCTKPGQSFSCIDCGAKIGGRFHISVPGNKRVSGVTETSQAGYLLISDQKDLQQPHDRLSPQTVSVLQLLIHASMLVGFHRNSTSATK